MYAGPSATGCNYGKQAAGYRDAADIAQSDEVRYGATCKVESDDGYITSSCSQGPHRNRQAIRLAGLRRHEIPADA